jgi:hypothetical protein
MAQGVSAIPDKETEVLAGNSFFQNGKAARFFGQVYS